MTSKRGRFEGKVAVITGGNSGIGRATARLFQEEGARVAFIGRDQKSIDETLRSLPGDNLGFRGDVTSKDDLIRFFHAVGDQFGRIDTLFVNAGIAKTSEIEAVTEEFYDEMFNINVRGAFFTVQKALPLLKDGASIVMCTSVVSHFGSAQAAVYSGTKAALRSFVQCFAAELLPRGIRVNSVSPGPTETPIIGRSGVDQQTAAAIKSHLAQVVPMKRMANAEEVAKAVLFMASEDASFTTGSELMVDGGWTEMRGTT
jgi:NAD(P)-dependent dehydrogenase (short-subunit alcohol dehydrogenase family)